ncbi:MAG TPA: asparagine synthase C-terminal domain-containing protein [Nitrosopumilaceae archaeon]|nr:asparagine synthase C-terminal domain-containing protein [Nitrosopumilaceae archaeon]
MMLNLRYNPTDQGILGGTQTQSNVSKLSYTDFLEKNLSYDFCVNKTKEILEKNINSIKNKKIVIGLSGGTDSSINTLLLSQRDDISLKLFSIGFNDKSDEFDDARIVAKLTNCEYKEIVLEDIITEMPEMVWKFGSPKSNLWPYYNFKTVRKLGSTSTLSGEGGDELFGGYFFRYLNYLKIIPKTPIKKAERYLYARSRDWIPNQSKLFGKRFKKNHKNSYSSKDLISFFIPTFDNKLNYLNQIFLADFNYKLRLDFNLVDTIFANKEKIQIHSPFLDKNLIRFATHIPYKYKLSKTTSKMILRDILKKIGAPKRIYEKPKQGWGMQPTTIWNRGLSDKCEKFLIDGTLVRDGWINRQWLKETYQFIEKKKRSNLEIVYPFINKIWDILGFEIFYIQRILHESKKGRISDW